MKVIEVGDIQMRGDGTRLVLPTCGADNRVPQGELDTAIVLSQTYGSKIDNIYIDSDNNLVVIINE